MIKFIVLLTFFISLQASAVTYVLMNELYKDGRYQEIVNSLKAEGAIKQAKKAIFVNLKGGYEIADEIIYQSFGALKHGKRGEIVTCDGFKAKCLIIKGMIKIYIPRNFNFEIERSWSWQDYQYQTIARSKYSLFGQQFDAIEILAFCNNCDEHVVRFTYDKIRGVIDFKVETEYYSLKYVLSDKVGFLAPK